MTGGRAGSLRVDRREASASVADLGTLAPIAAGLVLVNGVDPVAAFALAGALFIAAGLAYRVPVPVQPIKAAAAIAIATRADPSVIAGAGLVLGAILLVVWALRLAPLLVKVFPKPIIRGNQAGVGALLVVAAVRMIRQPAGADAAPLAAAAIMVVVLALGARRKIPIALALVAGGVVWTLLTDGATNIGVDPGLPHVAVPSARDLLTALTLLVIPQLPLTLSNAVVGTSDLERDYYGAAGERVTAGRLCLSCGAANMAVGLLGGMPLCHGSSGLTAYYRLGARTGGVNLVAGATLLVAGLVFGNSAPALFALIPPAVLGALLAYAGVRHALLLADQRGAALGIAIAMGITGVATRNLAWGMAFGLPAWWLIVRRRMRGRPDILGPASTSSERITP